MLEAVQGSGGRSRWQVLAAALSNSLSLVDDSIEIGALLFPMRVDVDSMSCAVPGHPDLLPALHHFTPLLELLDGSVPAGSTPTAAAIDIAANALHEVRAAESGRALVLATDGGPDCNTGLNPSTCTCVDGASSCTAIRCLDDARSVERITHAASLGLPTYVIGIQDANVTPAAVGALEAMADAGQRPQSGAAHRYYAASSEDELSAALTRIRSEVGSCTFLTSSVPNAQGTISVSVDGAALPFDSTGATGWNWVSRNNGELLLASDACALSQHGDARLEATLECASQ
jgi:hypothetical protein